MSGKLVVPSDWSETRRSLQQSLRVISSVRASVEEEVPNRLEYSVTAREYGASTGRLPVGGEMKFDYGRGRIEYERDGKVMFDVEVSGKTQKQTFDEVVAKLRDVDGSVVVADEKIEETAAFEVDKEKAGEYARLQYGMHRVLALVRAELSGVQTRVALWPHGFDVSFIWFRDADGVEEREDAHLNFGFSPGSDGVEAYLFWYAWPVPSGLVGSKLPGPGRWNKEWGTPGAEYRLAEFLAGGGTEEAMVETLLAGYELAKGFWKSTR